VKRDIGTREKVECHDAIPCRFCCKNKCLGIEILGIRIGILQMREGLKHICDCREHEGSIGVLAGIRDLSDGLRHVAPCKQACVQKGLDLCLLGLSEVSRGLLDIQDCRKDEGIILLYKGIRDCEEGLALLHEDAAPKDKGSED